MVAGMSRVEEQIQHLDFVPQLLCDRRANPSAVRCGKPATWTATCNGCGVGAVVCGRCRLYLEVLPHVAHRCGAAGDPQKVLTFDRVVAE